MQWQVLWFVLAGFIFGFTLSTLWEWLYFRRERMRVRDERLAELEAELQQLRLVAGTGRPAAGRRAAGYYSPAVLLESEQAEEASPFSLDAAESGTPVEPPPPSPTPVRQTAPPSAPSPSAGPEPAALSGSTADPAPSPPPAPVQAGALASVPTASQQVEDVQPSEDAAQRAADAAPAGVAAAARPAEAGTGAEAPVVVSVSVYPAPPAFVEARPAAVAPREEATAPIGYPDNLSRVKGIGRTYMRRLFEAGIFTFHQLSQTDADTLRAIAKPPVSANVEEWPQEAGRLAEKLRRIGAGYRGPLPDDLTQIRGIGARTAQELYRAGIVTYDQLAALPREQLSALIPVSPSGEPIDHQRWIEGAAHLAAGKGKA